MLRRIDDFDGYSIGATDGDIGHVVDVLFDDATWVVRYLVVETGSWLSSRRVLISPIGAGTPDHDARTLPVSVTREQVRDSPDVETDRPVTRQHEMDLVGHYGFPSYWAGGGLWGEGLYPDPALMDPALMIDPVQGDAARDIDYPGDHGPENRHEGDPHLRSRDEVAGYAIRANDGEIGKVRDFLVDDATWALRYLIVETGHWWRSESVVIPVGWVSGVTWEQREITVSRSRNAVRDAPEHASGAAVDAAEERALAEHFGAGRDERPG